MEYAQCLFFLGEMYRDLEQPAEAIPVLQMAIKKHEFAAERQGNIMVSGVLGIDQFVLERTGFMKILAEEQIKYRQVKDGIETAEDALLLQQASFKNNQNS